MIPSIGRIVHYTIGQSDADAINKRRADATEHRAEHVAASTGVALHIGNPVSEGEVYPAVIVRVFGTALCNLQVLLDGSDTYWATSRAQGDLPFQWAAPVRVGA